MFTQLFAISLRFPLESIVWSMTSITANNTKENSDQTTKAKKVKNGE